MKKNLRMLSYSTKIQLGLRLFLAICAMFVGNFLVVAIAMFLPIFGQVSPMFGITPEEAAEAEKAKLIATIEEKVKKVVADSMKENVSKAALDAEVEKINKLVAKLSEEGMAELKKRVDKLAETNETLTSKLDKATEALNTQSAALKKLTDNGVQKNAEKPKSFREAVKDAILEHKDKILSEKNDDYGQRLSMKGFFEAGNKVTPSLTIKAPVDMLQSNIVAANVNTVRLTELDPQRVGIPLTIYPHVFDVFQSKSIGRPYMSLLVVYSYENGAATKTEGAASGKSSFLFKTVEFKSFFIATHFVLSDETLDDLEEALDEISATAPDKILDTIDGKVLSAAGDDATDIAGIRTANKMTAYATVFGAATIDNATVVDVIADAKLQCKNNRYRPNVVMMNPEAIEKLAAQKNTLEDSKKDRRVIYDTNGQPTAICGLKIIETTELTDDQLIVLDNKLPWIGKRKDLTMEIGYNGTDLTEGQKTVVMKTRIAFGVRDKAGIIYVSGVAAAVTALETI